MSDWFQLDKEYMMSTLSDRGCNGKREGCKTI